MSFRSFVLILNFFFQFLVISNGKRIKPRAAEERRFASFVDIGSDVYLQSLCLLNDKTQIKMQCSSTDKIKILKTMYGYNPGYSLHPPASPDACQFSIKDCNYDKDFSLDNECTGKNTCLTTIDKPKILNESSPLFQLCKNFNYVQISYQCLPNLPTKDICGFSKSELSHAYIITPNFPSKLEPGSNCECTLSSNFENGQILLRRVDMKLPNEENNQNCGNTYLEVFENGKATERKCGYVRESGSIFGSGANKLKLTFVSGETQNLYDTGFWLEVLASPPKENHVIDIVCNKGSTATLNNFGLENSEIIKKLKQIHEKIKRLNKTYLDPKLSSKLTNKTQLFIAKNNKKFLNMTSSIGLFGKKFLTNKDNNQLNDKAQATDAKNDKSSISQSDLEAEIDKFFASNDLLSKQLDDLIKLDDKQPNAVRKPDSNRLIDFLSLSKYKNKSKQAHSPKPKPKTSNEKPSPKPKVKQQKIKEEEEEKKEKEKEEAENEEEENEEEVEEKTKTEKEKEPNDFIKELETLNEELDIGEKLLNSKEGGPIALNKSTISETLAELIIDSPNQQSGQSAHLSSGKSVINANAQRQDIGNIETHHQNNSTDLINNLMPIVGYRLINNNYNYELTSQRQHTIQKRNTKEDVKTSTTTAIPTETLASIHKAPAQWLQPFKFKFEDPILNPIQPNITETTTNMITSKKSKNRVSKTVKVKFNRNSKTPTTSTTTLTTTTTAMSHSTIGVNNTHEYQKSTSNNSLDLNTSSYFLNMNEQNLTKILFNNETGLLKNCEKNLTKLTVFYSSIDKLNCYETHFNQSLLKCIDDLLETKLLNKIGIYYFVQLQPLYISKNKMNCYDRNNTLLNLNNTEYNGKKISSSTKVTTSGLSSSEYEYEDYNPELTSASSTILSSTSTKRTQTEPNLNSIKELYLKDGFKCSFTTKKITNRKKLIWKLYLILKNQTCLQINDLNKNEAVLNKKLNNSLLTNNQNNNNNKQSIINQNELTTNSLISRGFQSTTKTSSTTTKANFLFSSVLSNKIVLIVLISSSVLFILLANAILYIILKSRKKNSSNNNFSMSMNNRLLQNYLDLSLNSDNSTKGDEAKKKSKLKNASTISETATIIDDYVFSERNLEDDYQYHNPPPKDQNQNNQTQKANIEMNNFDNFQKDVQNQKPKMINSSQQSNENNNFGSISGLITGLDSRINIQQTEASNNNNHNQNHVRPSSNVLDGPVTSSTYEISRIPSLKKPIYSVSTIATQADMDKGTILAERKDFKYRNQDMSDVESQILSIELDCYASIGDWCNSKFNSNNITQNSNLSKKELASVTVNDYVAFKNCLNFQLQAARAMNNLSNLAEDKQVAEFSSDSLNQQPIRNRMIVRISSIQRKELKEKNNKKSESEKNTPSTEIYDAEKNLPKLIYDAYQSALAESCQTQTNPEDFLKSFQNNLYMNLDTIPNFKSIQGSLFNSKEFIENFLKINFKTNLDNNTTNNNITNGDDLKKSSTTNTFLEQNNDLEESFIKTNKKNPLVLNDPNMIYSQVESSTSSESGSFKSSSNRNSNSDISSSNTSDIKKDENFKSSSGSSSEFNKELASYDIENNTTNKTNYKNENFGLSKAEKFKKMLDQEKAMLEKAKKQTNHKIESKFKTFIYEDDDYSTDEYNYVNNNNINTNNNNKENKNNNNNNIDKEEDSLSNEISSKNVRFSDNVSYI